MFMMYLLWCVLIAKTFADNAPQPVGEVFPETVVVPDKPVSSDKGAPVVEKVAGSKVVAGPDLDLQDDIFEDYADYPLYDSEYGSHEFDVGMRDFHPDLMVTIRVPSGSKEFFHTDITESDIKSKKGGLIRGAFFVAGVGKNETGIEFSILDPQGSPIFEKKDIIESMFVKNVTVAGTYTFAISSKKSNDEKQVTFIVGTGSRSSLKKEHINKLDRGVSAVDDILRKIQQEGSYLWVKQKDQLKSVEDINMKVFWFTLAEFATLAIVAALQVYSIKGLLSYRRLY